MVALRYCDLVVNRVDILSVESKRRIGQVQLHGVMQSRLTTDNDMVEQSRIYGGVSDMWINGWSEGLICCKSCSGFSGEAFKFILKAGIEVAYHSEVFVQEKGGCDWACYSRKYQFKRSVRDA